MEEQPTSAGSSDQAQNRGLRNLAALTQLGAGKFPNSGAFGPLGPGSILINSNKTGDFHLVNQSYSLTSSGGSVERQRDSYSVGSGIDGPERFSDSDERYGGGAHSLSREQRNERVLKYWEKKKRRKS